MTQILANQDAVSEAQIPTVRAARCQALLETPIDDPELACALAFLRVGGIEQLAEISEKPASSHSE